MATLPMDIIIAHIFLKLTAKSLILLKCVCKSWKNYISTQEFITLHLNNSLSTSLNNLIILTSTQNSLCSVPLNPPYYPTNLLFPTTNEAVKKIVIGSHDGLVCVNYVGRGLPLWFCNPSIGFCREIPSLHLPRRPCVINYGFGYDHVNVDYKVVRLIDKFPAHGFMMVMSRQVSVYSLKADAWHVVEQSVPDDLAIDAENGAVLRNHLVHWMVWCFELRKCKIRCFDLCQENWVDDVPMPDYETINIVKESDPENRDGVLEFGVFDGCLFMSLKNEQQSDQISVDVWIMKEYGVRESWVKLLSVSDVRITRSLRMAPIVYSIGRNKILLRREYRSDHTLLWYNVTDGSVESAEFDGVGDCFWAESCIGSLVGVPDGQHLVMSSQRN